MSKKNELSGAEKIKAKKERQIRALLKGGLLKTRPELREESASSLAELWTKAQIKEAKEEVEKSHQSPKGRSRKAPVATSKGQLFVREDVLEAMFEGTH